MEIFDFPAQKKAPHTIIHVYKRPRTAVADFITNTQQAIDKIHTRNPTTAITIHGDTNIDILKLTGPFYSFLIENDLHTTITTPTRYDATHPDTATLIDNTLTTLTEIEVTAGTVAPAITDHLPTLTIFHKPTIRTNKSNKTLSIARYNKNKLKITTDAEAAIERAIANTNEHTNTSDIFHSLQLALQNTIEKHEKAPKKRKNYWSSPKYKRQISKQRELHRERVRNPTPSNIRKHATYRNKLAKRIKQEKKKMIEQRLDEARTDPKQKAKVLSTVIPKKSATRTSPTVVNYEGETLTTPQAVANALNDHYITIGRKTTAAIPPDNDDYIQNDQPNPPAFTLQHTTEEIVTKTMEKINRNKASDIFKIKPTIIKDLTPFIAPTLTTLFNRAITENEYPDSLKLTKAIELYKGKDRTLPENYRPISLLPIIAKILDTVINEQLMEHLTKYNIISHTQYAFRPNSNCTLALQTILNSIHKHKKQHRPTLAIYIDLSKAYDTVSHEKLLNKLQTEFNFSPTTTTFFASYFKNRKQSLHTQHAQSETQTITHGIPQGSTLSTTFFLLYINNIIHTVPNSKVFTYADDTTLIVAADTESELNALAQSELKHLIRYFHHNNLVPNPTKTQYTVFYPRPPNKPFHLKIGSREIAETKQAPLLGITVQENLKHETTITNIIRKLQPTIQKFRYANKLLPTNTMTEQYYSLAYPHLIGAIAIWGTDDPNATRLQPLIRTQKKLIRLIKNLPPRTHTKPLMAELKILSVPSLYTLRVCAEMHAFIHPKVAVNRPEHSHHYVRTETIHQHLTRRSQQQTLHQTHSMEHYTREYTRVWNSIPQKLRETTAPNIFKRNLKTYLLALQLS